MSEQESGRVAADPSTVAPESAGDPSLDDRLPYREVVESSPDVVTVITLDGTIRYQSAALEDLSGFPPEETIGRSVLEFIHPDDRQRILEAIREAARSETIRMEEYRWRAADGAWRWFETTGRPLGDVPGIQGFVCVTRDITEHKATMQALRESERRFRELFEGSLDGAYISTADGRILAVNQAFADMLGYESQEALQATSATDHYVDPEERERLLARFREQGEVHNMSVRLRRVDDESVVHCELSSILRRRGDGEPTIMGIVRDVTRRRAREAALRKLSAVVEQAHDSVLIVDVEGRIEYVNGGFERIMGYTADEVVGRDVEILDSGLQGSAFHDEIWDTILAGEVWKGTFLNRNKDGSIRHHEARISPIQDDDGEITHLVSQARDVTREKELEEALDRAERMRALGRLSGGIAHHFNNLLTAINGYAELLRFELPEGEPREDLERIQEAARRATQLTRQLVAFSSEADEEPEDIDLAALVSREVRRLEREVPDEIVVDRESEAVPPVRADEARLERMVWNLLENARDAVSPSGRIAVRVETVELSPEVTCPCGTETRGEYVRLTVADDGAGMDADTLDRAFEPFFSTKGEGRVASEGVGLGLTFVYAVAENLGGHVCARSRPGEGARFEVLLPPAGG